MEEINLKSLFNYYLEHIKVISICTLIFFLAAVVYTVINRPKYVSESAITITGDLNSAKTLSTNYAPQVTNNSILQTVISNLGLNTTVKNIKQNIKAESDTSSDTIFITVENVNSEEAIRINSKLNRVFINYIENVYGTDRLVISSDATITGGGIVKKYAKQIVTITMVGFALGIIYIFIKFYFDNTIKSEEDAKLLKLDIFGVVPKNKSKLYKEAYQIIISNITTKQNKKVVLLTSVDEVSNKDETVFDLAKAYSKYDKKVLIIDADLKNNKQAELFNIDSTKGYTDLVNTNSSKYDSYISKTDNKLIDVIVNGSNSLNAVEVLSSNRNKDILNDLKNKYDIIIISAPPAIGTNGTDVLSKNTDINLLVVSNEITKLSDIKETQENDISIDGIIINKANIKLNSYSIHHTKNYYNK